LQVQENVLTVSGKRIPAEECGRSQLICIAASPSVRSSAASTSPINVQVRDADACRTGLLSIRLERENPEEPRSLAGSPMNGESGCETHLRANKADAA
jgi:molecular chaperone IbpA